MASDAIILATGLVNNLHLIRGTVARTPHEKSYEFTPFAVLKTPQDRKFLFRSYPNMQWSKFFFSYLLESHSSRYTWSVLSVLCAPDQIDLNQIDFGQGDSIVHWEIHVDDINIADVTKQFRPL